MAAVETTRPAPLGAITTLIGYGGEGKSLPGFPRAG